MISPVVPTAAAPAAGASANVPKVAGKDKALDDKKKQMDAAEAERRSRGGQVAAMRTENCSRAKSSKANYESGVRLSRMNDKGGTRSWTTTSAPPNSRC